jgi:predicted DNA-binding transcriptional regulator YafY
MPFNGTFKFDRLLMSGSFKNKQNRIDRLLGLLRSDSHWTSEKLCQLLETSPRTLMRDLAELREQGYPIDADRGRGGGIRLTGHYGMGRLLLTDHEVMGLLLSLAITESIKTPLMTDSIKSVRQKIASTFPDSQRKMIAGLRSRILIGDPASEHVLDNYKEPAKSVVRHLTTSFFGTTQLQIAYASESGEITERAVEPQYILLNWPVWYVFGWDHLRDAPRMFRVDRIAKAKLLADFSPYFAKL